MQKKKKTKKGAKQLLYALNEGDLKEEFQFNLKLAFLPRGTKKKNNVPSELVNQFRIDTHLFTIAAFAFELYIAINLGK